MMKNGGRKASEMVLPVADGALGECTIFLSGDI